jgi:hypothetical protein
MKSVEISAFNPATHLNDVFATCILADDGTVSFEGETDVFPTEITVPGRTAPVTTADGIEYLQALRHEFNGMAGMASDIIEG